MFILYFILASVITTIISLTANGTSLAFTTRLFGCFKFLSKFFIIMAMAAIGLNTDIIELIKKGGKPLLLGFLCWLSITCTSLLLQYCIGIW